MNKKWMPHGITAGVLVVFIVLGLACASSPSRKELMQFAYDEGDVQFLAAYGEYDKVLNLLRTGKYKDLNSGNSKSYGDLVLNVHLTALMYAAQDGRLDVVQALVEKGANVNRRVLGGYGDGKTASIIAYEAGYIEIVDYLKEHGAIDFE
jgi:hypothetical protein